jgi:hypothetical protein
MEKTIKKQDRKTEILVEADIIIRIRKTGEEQNLTINDIACTWEWDESSRDAAEYWAVADWITDTFGNNIDWFSIKCWTGSPRSGN